MEEFIRWFLPIYLGAFFGIAFVWRSLRVRRMTGINPYVLGKSDNAHDFIGRIFRITILLVAIAVGLNSISKEIFTSFGLIALPGGATLQWVGIVALCVAIVWVAVAQAQMGRSWRIGIDRDNPTALVQSGVFAVSRNPIFLGMRVMLLGLFVVIPSALTLLTWILGDVLMQIQVRLEEEFLTGVHGQTYGDYKSKVRRWI
jgi:protein-S-isoprenylcysteine O-methyltransferase Ste14